MIQPLSPDPTLRHRSHEVMLTLHRPDGSAYADADVVVEQTRHTFAFGNIGFDFIGLANGDTAQSPGAVFGGADAETAERLVDLW
ncbi:1,4-beta-xylanase, partial [Nocardioides sp. NPDC057772]